MTDLPASLEMDELPRVAAAAVPLLAEYFSVDSEELADWRVQAYLIDDKAKFAAAGLLPPAEHAEFPHALSMGYEVWVNRQASTYYSRGLLLHELTHSFMSTQLGGCGPGWYMEAVAELMGGHAWNNETGELRLRVLPATRDDAPYWGRVPLVRAAAPLTIDAVMKVDNRRALPVKSYSAVWALAKFMDAHPRYRDRFRKLPENVLRQNFNDQFRRAYARDRKALNAEFGLFTATLEYGHDIEREAIAFRRGAPLAAKTQAAKVTIRADRGWQSSGVAVQEGQGYRYEAKGQFVIAKDPDGTPWPAEANGVTLAYQGGRPLGQLLAAVAAPGGLLQPLALDVAGEFTAPATGTLYLRVNDSPAELAENEGVLSVTLTAK